MEHYDIFIDGCWTGDALSRIEVTNPSNGEVVATVPQGGEKEARAAADAAYAAFPEWASRSAYERSELISRWKDLMVAHLEALARTMTLEQGKPIRESRGEIEYSNGFFSWYAEEAKRVYGDTIPASHCDKRIIVQKQPVGVVAVITPWNFPAAMIARKVAPALAAGCTVAIKPATQTPLTALKMVQFAEQAGIPKGVVNLVTGNSREIGEAWMNDERVRKLTFTGSTEVGKELMRGSARTVKKVSLELGGHAPVIVFDDADLDFAVNQVIATKFRNAGQTCICANRIFVQESVHDIFLQRLIEKVRRLKIGDGLEEDTDIGPLIDSSAVERVLAQIEQAVSEGARLETGGGVLNGLFIEPTVLSGVTDTMRCMREETFGPLAPVAAFRTDEEVIQRANDTIYGLSAYVFTRDLTRGIRVTEGLDYGIIGLNDGLPSAPQAPFGGFKQSGIGREGGKYGIEEYLEIKYVSIGLR